MSRLTQRDVEQLPKWAQVQIEEQLSGVNTSNKAVNNAVRAIADKNVLILELPIYWRYKGKTILLGMNWYRNVHFQIANRAKKHVHEIVLAKLPADLNWQSVAVEYTLHPKRKGTDMMNVVAIMDKFLMDALQEGGVIENDSCAEYGMCDIRFGGFDKKNPRLIAKIRRIW